MKQPTMKLIYWLPRTLALLFVVFLGLTSLDVFEMGLGFWQTALALFIHNIPAIMLLIILMIAWRYEIIGAIAFILGGMIYIGLLLRNPFEWYYLAWAAQISGMAFLIGTLFFVGWYKKRDKLREPTQHNEDHS